jgi:hypothetical protein
VTPQERAFHDVVVDGGALGAAVLDRVTRTVLASYGQPVLAHPAVLDILLGGASPGSPLTRASGGPPINAARELFVAGSERALFFSILRTGEVIAIATPSAMSVALGWTLVRTLLAALEAPLPLDPP